MGCSTNCLLNYCMAKIIVALCIVAPWNPASGGRLIGDQSPYGWMAAVDGIMSGRFSRLWWWNWWNPFSILNLNSKEG